jgi:hypothetical protein
MLPCHWHDRRIDTSRCEELAVCPVESSCLPNRDWRVAARTDECALRMQTMVSVAYVRVRRGKVPNGKMKRSPRTTACGLHHDAGVVLKLSNHLRPANQAMRDMGGHSVQPTALRNTHKFTLRMLRAAKPTQAGDDRDKVAAYYLSWCSSAGCWTFVRRRRTSTGTVTTD